jgi:hypothetical protein
MGLQKILQQVLGMTLIVFLAGCGSPAITPEPFTPTLIPSTATLIPPAPTPVPFTQTPLPPSMILQEGNNLPRTLLQGKPSSELADNRIGSLCHSPWCVRDETHTNDEFFDLGLKGILRLTLNETDAPAVDWSRSEFYVAPEDDDWITLVSRNITVAYILSFWDKANNPSGWEGNSSRFKTEEEIQRYLDYVQFTVNQFRDRIHYYEIWNEPNYTVPLQYIEPADYINLVKRTIPIIRGIDPEAKIIIGGISGLEDPEAREYLFTILQSDIMPMVDVVSWHPFFGDSPQYDEFREYYYSYPSLVQQIKAMASAHGFRGEYRADELTWRTSVNPNPSQPRIYSEITAAKYYARGIVLNLGMDVAVGVMIDPRIMVIRSTTGNLCTLMAGAKPESLSIEIQSQATDVMSYSFSLPDGDQLIVLWSNGVAVDDDHGVTSILTIPGFSNWNATAMDVLNGFEQELITSNENDNLVIRDLLIKDYPIIIRLSK